MKILHTINEQLENGFTKGVFDHIRNLLIGAFLLAIGTGQLIGPTDMFFSITQGKYAGVGVIAVALILIAINIYDGIRMISKAQMNILVTISTVFIYLFLTFKVLEMAWNFRLPSLSI